MNDLERAVKAAVETKEQFSGFAVNEIFSDGVACTFVEGIIRAALEALMEPSEETIHAAVRARTMKETWQAMLRHILEEDDE